MPPVADEPSHGSSGSGSSSSFPETAEIEPDPGVEETSSPLSEVRAAIEEKLAEMKEEAKERVKEKIRNKIEDAIATHNDKTENFGKSFRSKAEKRLKTAAKDAVKKLVKEHHSDKGGLLRKLAELRRH